jgi:peptide/nickel transport system permease protein
VCEQPFIEAARATGVTDWQIMTRHLLRNVVSPVAVLASFDIGNLILSIAALNFLGLGAQPPTPEWGVMLNDAHPFLQTEPHLVLLPAAAIVFTVLGFSLVGDGVRDWLDPRGG